MSRPITSTANPLVKELVRLRQHRIRSETGRFLIEGFREIKRALEAGVKLEKLCIAPTLFLGPNEETLVHAAETAGCRIVELGEAAFRKVADRDRPEGLLAVASVFTTSLAGISADGWFLVVESIERPGNLGTMLRTADAAGVGGVIVCDPTTDLFHPKVVRASLGCLFTVKLAVAPGHEVRRWLVDQHVRILATSPAATRLHWEVSYRGKVAIVIGGEQHGLSADWLAAADEKVRIPMAGSADSLNAAAATAILLFEAVRDRSS